jgi:hypothetical protein
MPQKCVCMSEAGSSGTRGGFGTFMEPFSIRLTPGCNDWIGYGVMMLGE